MNVVKTPAEQYAGLPRSKRTQILRRFIVRAVADHPGTVTTLAARTFGVSRQAVSRQIDRLVSDGLISVSGVKKGRIYKLRDIVSHDEFLDVTPELHEDEVWTERFFPLLRATIPENVQRICAYGFTEMLNNVIDHSESSLVTLSLKVNAVRLDLNIFDQGVGIFSKIQKACDLETPRIAVFELTKGKFTTDPERHTGEGIFFTSRMFDSFAIMSGSLYLAHNRGSHDWLLENREDKEKGGTSFFLQIDPHSGHTVEEILTHYATEQDDYAFNKTTIAVKLAIADGEQLVSRSQAKRIAARLDRFKEVILDFKGIASIGPAFADELFRVFHNQHPAVRLMPINANEEVTRMIRRAETATGADGSVAETPSD